MKKFACVFVLAMSSIGARADGDQKKALNDLKALYDGVAHEAEHGSEYHLVELLSPLPGHNNSNEVTVETAFVALGSKEDAQKNFIKLVSQESDKLIKTSWDYLGKTLKDALQTALTTDTKIRVMSGSNSNEIFSEMRAAFMRQSDKDRLDKILEDLGSYQYLLDIYDDSAEIVGEQLIFVRSYHSEASQRALKIRINYGHN